MILLLGCTHTLSLRSEPNGAQVYAINSQGKRGALIGQTPVVIDKPTQDKLFLLEVTKEGYETRQIVTPVLNSGAQEMMFSLQKLDSAFFESEYRKNRSQLLNDAFGKLLSLQAAIVGKKSKEVAETLKKIGAEFEDVAWYHSLLGNHYYLIGDRAEAKQRFEKSLLLDPTNSESAAMLRLIGDVQGNKKLPMVGSP